MMDLQIYRFLFEFYGDSISKPPGSNFAGRNLYDPHESTSFIPRTAFEATVRLAR
jgi:hypothetical protein